MKKTIIALASVFFALTEYSTAECQTGGRYEKAPDWMLLNADKQRIHNEFMAGKVPSDKLR